jgi:hypothetical protein
MMVTRWLLETMLGNERYVEWERTKERVAEAAGVVTEKATDMMTYVSEKVAVASQYAAEKYHTAKDVVVAHTPTIFAPAPPPRDMSVRAIVARQEERRAAEASRFDAK